jgi:hypothetical protein
MIRKSISSGSTGAVMLHQKPGARSELLIFIDPGAAGFRFETAFEATMQSGEAAFAPALAALNGHSAGYCAESPRGRESGSTAETSARDQDLAWCFPDRMASAPSNALSETAQRNSKMSRPSLGAMVNTAHFRRFNGAVAPSLRA